MKLLLTLFSIPLIVWPVESITRCGRNEVFNQCGSLCELKCGDFENKPCPLVCGPPACQCAPGFRRHPTNRQCVRPNQCPASPQPIRCRRNEVFDQCGATCELKCGDSRNKPCPLVCGPPACKCANGFRRHPTNGQCVRPNQCPVFFDPSSFCRMNEVLVQCPPRCEPTCDNLNVSCPPVCGRPGCVCAPGFVRAPISNDCILKSQCSPSTPKPVTCQKNEVFLQCSSPCEPTCENQNPTCVKRCDEPKCQCNTGFVRDTKTGACISPSKCHRNPPQPVTCQRNEVFLQCSSPCEPTCENQNPACVMRCDEPKCQCKTGFVRDTRTGACISPSRCRKSTRSQVTCQINEVFLQCSSPCEPTCEDQNPTCVKRCDEPKCQCNTGFVRDTKTGACISPSQCHRSPPQPVTCGRNEVFDQCGATCELKCGDSEDKPCPLLCAEPACKCAPGFRRHPTNGQCVKPSECPMFLNPPLSCGMNEVLVQCPPRCEPTCNNLNVSCPPVCGKPGCVCASGFVRAPVSNDCILKSQCSPSTPKPVTCQKNEVFLQCSSPCEPTCEDQNPTCVKRCDEPKCQCNTGFVRDTKTGACISPSQCHRNPPQTVTCQRNEVFLQCSSPCEPTCEDQNPTCVKRCDEPKCQCNTGFVRDTRTGACISPSQCRRSTRSQVTCQKNEVFLQCSSPCEPTCEDQNPTCVKRCDEPKCQCNTGFVRDTKTGACISPSQCHRNPPRPVKCGKNEVFDQCGATCELKCGDFEDKPCPLLCAEPACKCAPGFRRHPTNGQCVKPSECPMFLNPPLSCGMNEVLVQCPPRCEPTCNNLNVSCPPVCGKPGCVCASGFVRAPISNDCILKSQCSPSTPKPVTCQRNEVFLHCSSPCEPTCEDQNPTCVKRCDEPKCQCNTGFVRDTKTGACISPSQCHRNPPQTVTCQRNEVFLQCSSPCEPTCEDQNPTCVKRCNEPKCQCNTGFVRDTRTGACISPSQCFINPPDYVKCPPNEIFTICSSLCEPSCDNRHPTCGRSCDQPKCECISGLLRDKSTGRCVEERRCPRKN
uniref:Trypsin Inhibitor like cysteine rich domain protein n=1 Tax=Strongyloides venezuelensis TaxID=75913 RepID=A0A0K0FVD9_STRVS